MNKLNIHRCWGCNDLRKRSSHICAQTQKWLVKLQLWFLIITVKPKNYLVNTECGTNTCPHNTCSNNPIKSAQFGVSYRHLLNGLWWYHKTRDQSKDIVRLIASSYEVGCESGKKKRKRKKRKKTAGLVLRNIIFDMRVCTIIIDLIVYWVYFILCFGCRLEKSFACTPSFSPLQCNLT